MPLKSEANQQPKQQPKRPNPSPERTIAYNQQNCDSAQSAIAARAQSAASSLQSLDRQLASFEENYASAVAQRVSEVPTRINALIAQKLNQSQTEELVIDALEVSAWTIPEFELPPAAYLPSLPGI